MIGFRVSWGSAAVLVVVSLAALLVVAGCGAVSHNESAAAFDQPTVILGGYTFASNSNVLTHPDFTVKSTTPTWTGKGYGDFKGNHMTVTFAAGGKVAGVNTLLMTITIPGIGAMDFWLAQDTQGNIHYLKAHDGPQVARLTGVAAGQPAWFWLPRAANVTTGFTWYEVRKGVKKRLNKILSASTTWQGMSGLVGLTDIYDDNGDHKFSTSWDGPDNRHDVYFSPTTHGLRGCQLSATGGYTGPS